ncbi:MAG: ATP-dependent zinc metalloprotease FtsH [Gemmataceae bacterium]|nr:ATP-dependent zinc metalloprotease FtsH [Gemmataceae bacterium]
MPSPREQPNPPGRSRRRPEPPASGSWLWLVLLLGLVLVFLLTMSMSGGVVVKYSDFMQVARDGADHTNKKNLNLLSAVWIGSERLEAEVLEDAKFLPERVKEKLGRGKKIATFVPKDLLRDGIVTRELEKYYIPVSQQEESGAWIPQLLMLLLPALLLLGIFFFFLLPRFRDPLGGGFLSNYIKSPAKRYEKNKMRVTFEDVADMQSAKMELQEVVDFLKEPQKFQRLGAQVPKGVLLIGPPGTGKTLLARAVAGEAGVPFFSISGSEFIQMFVGVGASRVRDMFKTAKENSPCLLFVDELDAVGRMRGAGVGGGSDEREQTLNQILTEMDGFQPNESVIVLAATNRPDVLDSALLRPGRFDRHVTIDRPTWQGRMEILKVHTRNKPLADDVNLEVIARKMIGMTGADLRNLANEAALLATRENKARIDRNDFERAADRVLMGPKRDEILTEDAKRQIAYHEAGHALVAWFQPDVEPPQKVTVVPRGRAGGVTFFGVDEDRLHYGLSYFQAELAAMMGGRAAERLIYGQIFAGAESDLKQATRRARYMVTHWGMSDRLGPMSFRIGEEHVFLGKEIQEPRDFSEATAAVIDDEVQRILREADQRAYEILESRRPEMERLVELLLQKEEVYREELEEVFGPRKAPLDGQPSPMSTAVFAPGSS